MSNDDQQNLQGLSHQLVDLFIQKVFSENKIDKEKINLTDEQKESLKQTFDQLKTQVDTYVTKHTTENDGDVEEPTETHSPLREFFYKNRQKNEDTNVDNHANEEK